MAQDVRLELDHVALAAFFADRHGPVANDLERRGLRVQAKATDLCPVDTGRLQTSIDGELGEDGDGIYYGVGTNVDYGINVEFDQPYLRPALDVVR